MWKERQKNRYFVNRDNSDEWREVVDGELIATYELLRLSQKSVELFDQDSQLVYKLNNRGLFFETVWGNIQEASGEWLYKPFRETEDERAVTLELGNLKKKCVAKTIQIE